MGSIRMVVVALWDALMSEYLAAHWIAWVKKLYEEYPFGSRETTVSAVAYEYGKKTTCGGDDWYFRHMGLFRLLQQSGKGIGGFPDSHDLPACDIDGKFVWDHGFVRYCSGLDGNGVTRDIFSVVIEVLCVPATSGFPERRDFFRRVTIRDLFDWLANVVGSVMLAKSAWDLMVPYPYIQSSSELDKFRGMSGYRRGDFLNHIFAREIYLSILETSLVLESEGYFAKKYFSHLVLPDVADYQPAPNVAAAMNEGDGEDEM